MNADLLMDLADCGSPETLIGAILKHSPDMRRPVAIDAIAHQVGIQEIREAPTDGFEGALSSNPEKTTGIILTRSGMHRRRQRFTIGHELGHFLIPSHQGNQQCTAADLRERRRRSPRHRREAEANRFSAGLLMPKPLFLKDLDSLGDADLSHIYELIELYDVSLEAAVNRYADLSSDICAFVFSKDGVVRYTRLTDDFPKLAVKAGDRLPIDSETARHSSGGQMTDWSEKPASVWLDSDQHSSAPAILEQCRVQRNGYKVTILYIDPAEVEEAEEDEELSESWQARF